VDSAYARALVGVYSPIRARYDLEAADQFMPQPFLGNNGDMQPNNDWLLQQANTSMILPNVPVEIGGMKSATFEGSLPALPINHNLTINIGKASPMLTGSVENNSEYTLHDAMLVTPSDWSRLGDIGPGESKQISISLAANLNGPEFYQLDASSILNTGFPMLQSDVNAARRTSLLQTALANNYQTIQGNWGIFLMGWVDQPVLPISLHDKTFKTIDTMLYIRALSPEVKTNGNTYTLPVSLFAWEASIEDVSPYRSWQLPAGGYILRFKPGIPISFRQIQSMALTLNSSAPAQITVSIWDYTRQAWHIVNLNGNNNVTTITQPEKYVTPDGEVKLKIIGNGGGWTDVAGSYVTLVVTP
jgi:hypothetical protein